MTDAALIAKLNKATSKVSTLEAKVSKLQKQVDGLQRSTSQGFAELERRIKALSSGITRLK